jgi:hypothetical protein
MSRAPPQPQPLRETYAQRRSAAGLYPPLTTANATDILKASFAGTSSFSAVTGGGYNLPPGPDKPSPPPTAYDT